MRENLTLLHANKGTDQLAYPGSLISTFVIHFLQSNRTPITICKISIFYLVLVAEQTGFSLTLSKTPDRFSHIEADILYGFALFLTFI